MIHVKNLVKVFGEVRAVDDVSFDVRAGEIFAFLGPNGAGKTTTMKCLLNLLRPQRGQVRVFGLDPRKHEVTVKRRLSYVPDQVAFYPWMTVRETLDYLASFREQWNRDTERSLMERFQLDPAQRTAALSKGPRTGGWRLVAARRCSEQGAFLASRVAFAGALFIAEYRPRNLCGARLRRKGFHDCRVD